MFGASTEERNTIFVVIIFGFRAFNNQKNFSTIPLAFFKAHVSVGQLISRLGSVRCLNWVHSCVCDWLGLADRSYTQKGSILGLMLCSHYHEILNNFFNRGIRILILHWVPQITWPILDSNSNSHSYSNIDHCYL